MYIRNYLEKYKLTQSEFAKRADVHLAYLAHILSGTLKPGRHVSQKISKASKGEILVAELILRADELKDLFDKWSRTKMGKKNDNCY